MENEISDNRFEFDDYADEGFLNDEKRCAYCHQPIILMPFIMNDASYCDVICARLSCLDSAKIFKYDKHQYDVYYKNELLSSSAANAYRVLRNIDIALMPITVDSRPDEGPDIIKTKYSSAIISYVNQVM